MAIEKQVNVVISAVDQYSKQILNFAGGFGTIASAAAVAEGALLGLSLAAAGLAVKLGKDLLNSAKDFHDGAIDVVAVAQASGTSLEQVNGILDDLTLRFPLTGKEAANAMELIAQMGFGSEKALKAASEAAVNLSMATGTDMQTSVKALTATMNSFDMGVEESERLMNLFSAAQFTSALSATDMADAIKYAGSMSKLTGQSVEGMTAALALLRNKGLEASQAGTTLRMAMANLMKETSKGTEALAKYGLTYDDVNPSVYSFEEIIGKFEGKVLDAKDAVDIFGVRQLAFTTLINDGKDAFVNYRNSITDTTAGIDAVQEKMAKWEVVIKNLDGSMDLLKKTMAGDLLPAIIDFIGKDEKSGIRGAISALQKWESETESIGDIIEGTFNKIADILRTTFLDAFEGDHIESFYKWIVNIVEFLGTNLQMVVMFGSELAKMFVFETNEPEELKNLLYLIKDALLALIAPIASIHDAFATLFYMVNVGIDGIQNGFAAIMVSANGLLLGMQKVAELVGFDKSAEIEETKKSMEEWQKVMEDSFDTEPPKRWMDTVIDLGVKANGIIEGFGSTAESATEKAEKAMTDWAKILREASDDLVVAQGKVIKGGEDATKTWAKGSEYAGIFFDKTKEIVEEASKEMKEYKEVLVGTFNGEEVYEWVEVVKEGTKETSKEIDKTKEKLSEWEKHQLDLEKIQVKFLNDLAMAQEKLKGEVLLKQMEIDLKKVEAQAQATQSAFDNIGKSVSATASAVSSMFSDLVGFEGSMGQRWKLEDMVQQQIDIQQQLVNSQVELTDAQRKVLEEQEKMMKQKREQAAKDGGAVPIEVTVGGDTKPWLKGLMQELMEEVFVQAASEAFSCMCES